MNSFYKMVLTLLAVTMVCSYTPPEDDPLCSCDHCYKENPNDTEENGDVTLSPLQLLYKEDSDGDGDLTICARDREFNDRTFPSVCHMLCFNRCPILRFSTEKINGTKRYIIHVYRNNYYKLRNGEC